MSKPKPREASVGFGSRAARIAAGAEVDRVIRESAANHVSPKVYRGVTGFDAEAVRNTPIAMPGVQGVQGGTSPHRDGMRNLEREGR